jgi:hypothetical protein
MTLENFRSNKSARRKTLIFVVAVALALLWLLTGAPVQPPVVTQ